MKKKIICLCSFALALVLSLFAMGFGGRKAYAETADDGEDVPVVTVDTELTLAEHFMDENLYTALKTIAQQIKIEYTGSNDNKLLAGDLAPVKVLDLTKDKVSVTFIAPSGPDITLNFYDNTSEDDLLTNIRGKITNIDGIEYLRGCTNLTTLILDGHEIPTIDSYMLLEFPNLNTISVKNNGLTSVTLPTTSKICNVDFSGNELKAIDLSYLTKKSIGEPYAVAHLENNLIEDVAQITMPNAATTEVYVYLANNFLTDVTKENIVEANEQFEGHKVSLLVQGIKKSSGAVKFVNNTYIRITPDLATEGFAADELITAKAFYRAESDFAVGGVETLASESGADGRLILPTGRLIIRYYNDGTEYTEGFTAQRVDVYPDMPTIKVEIDGKIQDKNPERVKGTFKVIAMAPEGALVQIRFADTDYSDGNYIEVEESGKYIIYAQATIDGLTSEEAYIFIENTSTTRMMWTLIIVVGVAVLIIGGVYLYKWFKSGAIVTPLSDREIAREQIRRDRQQRKNDNKQQ